MAQVKITETVLRDSHQSLVATRMKTEEMLPILAALDKVGYHSLEAWGGATFDSCLLILLRMSFTVQKLVSFIRFHLSIFLLIFLLPWETDLKHSLM